MNEYVPVPVEAARSIAHTWHKNQVVILAWDQDHQLTHTTTYGVTAFDKENAAAVGEKCTLAIGGDLGRKQNFEDFHKDYSPAMLKEAVELLQRIHQDGACMPETYLRVGDYLRRRGNDVVDVAPPAVRHVSEDIRGERGDRD